VIVRLAITGLVSFALSYGVYYVLQGKHAIAMSRFDVFLICSLSCYFLLLLISLKKILVFLVTLYQYKASDEMRLRCVFAPSCSEYMILSLEKYGAVFGLVKGIKRLSRCKHSNGIGGEDYP
jgi:putative component of membrane protein insertase Oxa1/YidC/SpoIIIJ protein YidD